MKTYKTKSGKTYTKKQICEAIGFWKKQLKKMNEDRRAGLDITYIDADDVINNPNEFPLKIYAYDITFNNSMIYLATKKTPTTIKEAVSWALEHFYNNPDWYSYRNEYIHPKTGALTSIIDSSAIDYLCNQLRHKGIANFTMFNDENGKISMQLTFATDADMRNCGKLRGEFVIV